MEKFNEFRAKVTAWYLSLSSREKMLIIGSVAIAVPLTLHSFVYKPIREKFAAQRELLVKMEQDLKTIPHILDRYSRFKKQKDEIEAEFKEINITEGEKTFLENIITGKVDPGFQISPATTVPFGAAYEQATFSIKFNTSSLQNVVDVLTAISEGKKRMLLTSVTITKLRTGDKLEVQLSASSIRPLQK